MRATEMAEREVVTLRQQIKSLRDDHAAGLASSANEVIVLKEQIRSL